MSNVIPFKRPTKKKSHTKKTKQQPRPEINITNKITESLVNNLSYYGYKLGDDISDVKNLALIIESINSLIAKKENQKHPFQHLAEQLFQSPSIKEDNIELKLKFHKIYELQA